MSLAAALFGSVAAAPLSPAELPPAAREWLPWALQGQSDWGCPQAHDGSGHGACVWPGRLQLQVGAAGGSFKLEVQVFGPPQRVKLPGEPGVWPQGVSAAGKPLAVTAVDELPGVWLPAGSHVVEGRWSWGQMPQNLRVPAEVGAISVGNDGAAATQARLADAEGRIWLRANVSPAEANDALSVQTVRLVNDEVPLTVTTAFELRVSGKARPIELPRALLPGSVALALNSPLPARLADNGALVVQARPGSWHVEVQGRVGTPLQALKLPEGGVSAEEVWLVQAQPNLRLIRPEGPLSVDPRQVEMPSDWRKFPAFRMRPGETLKLTELQRGNAQTAPDALTERRHAWLDFDGGGWTLQDDFEGQLKRSSRLEVQVGGDLGRVSIDGDDQPVTRLNAQGPAGFEVREGQASLQTDSRWPSASRLPASGWSVAVQSLQWTLQLPPGWLLLHAQGPDRAAGAWTADWTLWDFFFVLLAALAAARLSTWRMGALLGLALTLTWHAPDSPPVILWFALLALGGLMRVMPAGRGGPLLLRLKTVVAGALALCLLPFAVQQVRLSLYPSLETPVRHAAAGASPGVAAPHAVEKDLNEAMAKRRVTIQAAPYIPPPEISLREPKVSSTVESLDTLDPGARVQTGPGLPTWSWRQHQLSWSGPVLPEQTLTLWLAPPWAHAGLRITSLVLMALALAALMGWRPRAPAGPMAGSGAGVAAGLAAGWLVLGMLAPSPAEAAPAPELPAKAAWPNDEQLKGLRDKLAAAPDCMPGCAELARLIVSAAGSTVQLRAEVHAQAQVALPLPGQGGNWLPHSITVDGQAAAARRDDEGRLWLAVPVGVHQVTLTGEAGSAGNLDISLPVRPRSIQAELKGWALSGLDPSGQATGAISLSREVSAAGGRPDDAGTQRDALPPLVKVSRTLRLGLRWEVVTDIERISPSRAPVQVRWTLLPGEAVSDARVTVAAGVASVQLGADESLSFSATLKPADSLALKAGNEANQIELWTLAASTQWHTEASGLAPSTLQRNGRWLPQWRPWPGESLRLAISKPAGVAGQTLTLDRAAVQVQPGERSTDVQLDLQLRASLGTQQVVRLPADAELLEVTLQGETLPLALRDGQLSLPITPGELQAKIRWREPRSMGLWWRHPGVELGLPGVNDQLTVQVPQSRIVLALGGPLMGPAVLLWGALAVVLALAAWAPRWLPQVPLARSAWMLLALGVAPVSLGGLAWVALWFGGLQARQHWSLHDAARWPRWVRILVQLGLVLLTLAAMAALLNVLRVGLLGLPDMLVAGPDSNAWSLHWYADRLEARTASAWVVSMPVWVYRAAMLVWALWLASSLLKWVSWGWGCFSAGGLWPAKTAAPTP